MHTHRYLHFSRVTYLIETKRSVCVCVCVCLFVRVYVPLCYKGAVVKIDR